MADRYWVGGTGTWNTTSTTNWSDTSGGASGASVPTAADNVFFDSLSNTGINAFTVNVITGVTVSCLDFTATAVDVSMSFQLDGTVNVSGNWSNHATLFRLLGTTTVVNFTPAAGSTKTITTNGYIFEASILTTIRITGAASNSRLQLADALTFSGTLNLVSGILDLNGFTLTTGTFSSSGTAFRSVSFGSNNIILNSNAGATTVLAMATATNFTWTGTGGFVRNQRNTATFTFGSTAGGSVSNAPNLTFALVTSTSTITGNSWFKNLNFATSTCIVNNSVLANSIRIAGVLSLNTISGTSTIYQGFHPSISAISQTLDTTKALGSLSIDAVGITVSLARATTIIATGSVVMYRGTLNLNGFDLTTGAFQSSGSTARSVAFGSNNIILSSITAATTILAFATATNFTWTGTGGFVRNQAATATVSFGSTAGGSVSNAPNLTVNAGASNLVITTNSWLKNTNFTGSTCTVSGAGLAICVLNVSGDLTLAVGGTFTAVQPVFRASSTLTSAGRSVEDPTINGVGITVTLNGAFTLASGIDFFLVNGTLNLNAYSLTCRNFNLSAGTKNITFNGGTIFILASFSGGANSTGFTTTAGTGTGTISFTSASNKSLSTVGVTFNCTINQGGTGPLGVFNDLGTINNLTNTVQPASILFGVGTTTYFNNFSVAGTAGNLITIATSGTAATHTLSKSGGAVTVSFCSIASSVATGGAIWQAPTANGNVDAGNNTGWIFSGIIYIFGEISELINVSDLRTTDYIGFSVINERVLAQDIRSSIYSTASSLSESIYLTDSSSALRFVFGDYADSISLTDALSRVKITAADYTDSISLTASSFFSQVFFSSYVDSISLTDSQSTIYNGVVFSTENVSVSDNLFVFSFASAEVQDSINASSTFSSRFSWDLIEDSQDTTWQPIVTVTYLN